MARHIGRYEVVAELGRGGFGHVYRCLDPSLGTHVAVKTLTADGDAGMLMRFRNEAATSRRLRHPNIVTIYDFGDQDGVPYIVMELLEGEDLQRAISARAPLSLLKKIGIMSQVAAGLGHAHNNGIIHRDVKPANVMLLQDGTAKIMDFGIALITQSTQSRITPRGAMIGTFRYMAPEQFRGSEPDVRSDIFSYGLIFYELLSGAHPFHASEAAALMYNILSVDPVPIGDVMPDCPAELQSVLGRLLLKDPDLRYQSLDDVLFDIEPALHKLRERRSVELVQEARQAKDANELEKAQALIREALTLNAGAAGARDLREQIQVQLRRHAVRPRVDDLVKRAQEALAGGDPTEAAKRFESAIQLDPVDPTLRERLASAKVASERLREAMKLVADAEVAVVGGDYIAAAKLCEQALEKAPGLARASEIQKRAEFALAEEKRKTRLVEETARARRFVEVQAWNEASELLTGLQRDFPDVTEIRSLAERLRAGRKKEEDERKLTAGLAAARAQFREGDLPAALASLEALAIPFPNSAEAGSMLAAVRLELESKRQRDIVRRSIEEGRQLAAKHEYEAAIKVFEAALAQYPADPELQRERRAVSAAGREAARRAAIEAATSQANQLRKQARFADAVKLLEDFLASHGTEQAIASLRDALLAEQETARRSAELRDYMQRVNDLIAKDDLKNATLLLKASPAHVREDAELTRLLGDAERQKKALAEKRAAAEALSKDVQPWCEKGRFEDAFGAIKKFEERYGADAQATEVRERVRAEQDRAQKKAQELLTQATALIATNPMQATALLSGAPAYLRERPEVRNLEQAAQRVAEQRAAEQSAAEQRAVEQKAAERRATEQRAADQKAAEQRAAEQRVAEQRAAEHRAAEQKAAEQRALEQRAAEQRASEQRAAEQRAVEQRAAEQRAVEQRAVEQRAVEQRAAEQRAAEQRAAEQRAAEQRAAEQRTAEQRAAEKRDAEQRTLNNIRALIAGQDFEGADKVLTEALAAGAENPEFLRLRKDLEAARRKLQAEQAEQEVRQGLLKIRGLLPAQPEPAANLLEGLRRKYPGRADLEAVVVEVREAAALMRRSHGIEEVGRLCAREDFEGALARLNALEPDGSGEVARARERVRGLKEQSERRRAMEAVQAAAGLRQTSPQQALQNLQALAEPIRRRAEVEAAMQECRLAIQAAEKRVALAEIEELISRGKLAKARTKHRESIARLGSDAAFEQVLSRIAALEAPAEKPGVEVSSSAAPTGVAEAPRSSRGIGLIVGGGLGLAAAAGGVWFFTHQTKPPVAVLMPVQIRTDPDGASVQVGDKTCQTPQCRLELAPGTYQVRAQESGYQPAEQPLVIEAGKTPGLVSLSLKPVPIVVPAGRPIGTLAVHTGTADVLVFIDNVQAGRTDASGNFSSSVEAAAHTVRVQKVWFNSPAEKSVTVAANRSVPVAFTLVHQTATLEVRGAPAGVDVYAGTAALGRTSGSGPFTATVFPEVQSLRIVQGTGSRDVAVIFEPGQTKRLEWASIAPPVAAPPTPVKSTPSGDAPAAAKADPVEQEWTSVRVSTDLAVVQAYLDKYPKGAHAAEAKSRMDSLVWARTGVTDAAALRNYLGQFADGAHAKEAKSALDELAWSAVNPSDPQSLRAFVALNAGNPHRAEAQARLDALDQANKKAAEANQQNQAQVQAQQAKDSALRQQQLQGIQDALDAFNASFDHKKAAELVAVWPLAPQNFRDGMVKNNLVMKLRATAAPVMITADTAGVVCELSNSLVVRGKGSPTLSELVTLKNLGNRWQILSINQR